MPAPFRTNPSTIARYFFHDCERFLYYSAASPEQRAREGLPTPDFDHSPLVAAILESGQRWEHDVVERLLKGRVVVAPGEGELHTRRLSLKETLRCLRDEPAGRFLYQPTLAPPAAFYEKYGIDAAHVLISDNHPDLIEIVPDGEGRLFRVIDVKRGEALKLTHRVQILLYALELQALLEAEGITSARVDLDRGAVWLGKQPAPETFDLRAFKPHLERFLSQDLARILAGTARDARWHLYPRCEWCEFFEPCRDEMRRTDDVSRLENLTTYGKRHLHEEAQVQTLTQLGRFLKRGDADEVLSRCASLAGQRHRLQMRVEALVNGEPRLHGASSPDLPHGENIALYITVQQEPLGKAVYLAGVLVTAREDLRKHLFRPALLGQISTATGKAEPKVWVASSPDDTLFVRRKFIELLSEVLTAVDRYNQKQGEWKDKLTLQAFVHTETERGLLFAMLLEALHEPDLAERAMTLLFHFQGPELLHADRHPGNEVPYPVVVLQSAIGRLLALPVEVSHTLPEMLEALGSPFNYSRKAYYHFPLGHGLRAEALHAAWYAGKRGNLEEIRLQGRVYLIAIQSLLRSVRDKAKECLVAWPPRFSLPTGAGIRDRLLSRLAFFARYEMVLGCLAIREARAEARPTQVLLGQVIELRAFHETEMEVIGDLIREPDATGFPSWLLVRDSDAGRRAQVEYADYWYRNKPYGGPENAHRAVVGIDEVRTGVGPAVLRLSYARPFKDNPVKPGERFLLYQRFTDFTTDKIVGFLASLDQAGDGFLQELLRDPEKAAAPRALPPEVEKAVVGRGDHLGFTPSQAMAYEAIRQRRVTAVWGPPGTGKTHFLATAILGLMAAHAAVGRPFRVLVTAFTHAAIENLLRKIGQRQGEMAAVAFDLHVAKAKRWQSTIAPGEVIEDEDIAAWLEARPYAVLGSTVYSCLKRREELAGFDLVVIDEASQVRVPEAAVAISFVAPAGRLVLAGDHLQLAPIVAGIYPDAPPGEPLLHRSIFEAILPKGESGTEQPLVAPSKIVCRLEENFRMNDVLTGVAARLLYGPGYQCVSTAVARRRLPFTPAAEIEDIVRACLDPAYPLVLVLLDGIRAAQSNPIEAELVADLISALRDGLRNEDGDVYTDDAAFFRHGVFIVSPHHAQIRAIERQLEKRTWQVPPRVDTVDKLQGQEAEAVIVSYGVADPEFALREAEFIYGLNRLNVALTRARTKCVVCLPLPLVEATPQVLDVEAAAAGLAFMRRLVHLMETEGDAVTFEAEEFEARVLRFGGKPKGRGRKKT